MWGSYSLIVNHWRDGAAITSRVGRDAQGSAKNIGRLSDDPAIIAIWLPPMGYERENRVNPPQR